MEFIYGALGVILALLLFSAGVFTGWRVKECLVQAARKSYAEELTEKEREQLREEQEAFLDGDQMYDVYDQRSEWV